MDVMLAETEAVPEFDPSRDALYLDFDGTLVGIAPRPDAVEVPEGLAALLARLHGALDGAVAVVSGRSLAELERYLDGFPGAIVGSHGAERRGAAAPEVDGVAELHARLHDIADRNGLLAEIKTAGGALHFRHAPERDETARALAAGLVAEFPGFVVQPAKMAYEVKPRDATKAAALADLAAAPPFGGRRPIYLGDDATDEPAMEWAQARGGTGVKVGEGESVALCRLSGPAAVLAWLSAALEDR